MNQQYGAPDIMGTLTPISFAFLVCIIDYVIRVSGKFGPRKAESLQISDGVVRT
jgi:hypothetical protein